jgi:hypothetical protein
MPTKPRRTRYGALPPSRLPGYPGETPEAAQARREARRAELRAAAAKSAEGYESFPTAKAPRKPPQPVKDGGLLAYAQSLGPAQGRPRALLCAICGADWSHFLYGPPLVPTWTRVCAAHKAEVDPDNQLPDWLR